MIPLRDDNMPGRTPIVTRTFVGLCVLVFLWQMTLGPQGGQAAVYALGVIPAVLLGRETLPAELAIVPPSLTVLTSMFMHGGFMHLLGNMLYLWIFGDNVEDSMTRTRYLVFYLLCGVAAVLAQALPAPNSTIPMVGAGARRLSAALPARTRAGGDSARLRRSDGPHARGRGARVVVRAAAFEQPVRKR